MSAAGPHLVCLTSSGACGGAETSLLTLLGALRKQEPAWNITVIAPSHGPVIERCGSIGVAAIALPYPAALTTLGESGASASSRLIAQGLRAALTLPQYVTRLRRTLRDAGATVVHSNGLKAHISGALAKPGGVRLVWHLHDYVQRRPMTASVLRRLAHRADAIVANSESVRADAFAAFGGRARVTRVHNAVDLTAFRPDGPTIDLAALAGLPDDTGLMRVGLVATFARWKGHDVFMDAIERVHARARLRAYIIGGAVYETAGSQWTLEELTRRVAARGLSNVIGFTGHIDDVPAALRSLDIMVHASTEPEPFGMVIAEGMATARPVVAVNTGGASELFDDRVNAIGYRAGSAAELAQRIEELISNAAWRTALGAAAREAARERFSPDRMAAEFREAYLG